MYWRVAALSGANKIAVYDHYRRRNPIRAYVLLGGGDDTGLAYADFGPRRFRSVLERARNLRTSEELVPQSISKLPMSWRSLYDMINPDGDYNVFPFLEIMRGVRLSKRPRSNGRRKDRFRASSRRVTELS